MKLAKGSKSIIITPIIVSCFFDILFLIVGLNKLGVIFILFSILSFLLAILFLIFFRDPERKIGKGIVAAADGKIREITKINDKDIGECSLVSTFMNIYNVHVNRMPLDGEIKNIKHISGIHLPAFKKESENNERVIIIINTKYGKIKIVQIAGTLARRIVPYIKKGDKLKKGDKIGIIRLGSRVDVYVPKKLEIKVKVGERVLAGESVIA
jgi:phosphatidylserine decarboxylase